ncbi:MAG TPA: hypothetical protein VKT72_14015 [Candidatus Baltobacteraceae bacterium]|nr:hypothetical protein [Candidatus Baltobacteraceae bacterium]
MLKIRRWGAIVGAAALLLAASSHAFAATPVTVHVQHREGAEAVDVSGTAVSGTSVDIALYATISKDLPMVFLNRFSAVADANGHYALVAPIAGDYFRGTIITVQVLGSNGGSASDTWTVDAPTSTSIPSADVVPNN